MYEIYPEDPQQNNEVSMNLQQKGLFCKVPQKDCLTVKEACHIFKEVFDVSDRSFYRHHRKQMKFFNVGPRSPRIMRSDLLNYITQFSVN